MSVSAAKQLGERIGIDWHKAKFTPKAFSQGIGVEAEHGSADPKTDVTHDDPVTTGKIDWAHLKEDPEYYTKLKKYVEKEGSLRHCYLLGVSACLRDKGSNW